MMFHSYWSNAFNCYHLNLTNPSRKDCFFIQSEKEHLQSQTHFFAEYVDVPYEQ